MDNKCYRCRKNEARPEITSFSYSGCAFRFFKPGTKCLDCAKQEAIKNFDFYGRDLLKPEDGKISVNWEYFTGLSGSNERDRKRECLRLMLNIGVLSHDPQDNWEIRAGIAYLNLFLDSTCYFTRRDDALAYARLEFGQTFDECNIRQVG